jgi:Lar family restriction alleviation protein
MDNHEEEKETLIAPSALTEGLAACPFCGGKPERKETDGGGKYICCSYCNASTALHFDRAENLDDAWNRRVANADETP